MAYRITVKGDCHDHDGTYTGTLAILWSDHAREADRMASDWEEIYSDHNAVARIDIVDRPFRTSIRL